MEEYAHIIIGLLTLAGIGAILINRPSFPTLRRWVQAHRSQVDTVTPFVLIAWGGVIWALMIFKKDFSNVPAIIAGSLILCSGVFFLFKRF